MSVEVLTEAALSTLVEAVFYFFWNEKNVEQHARGWFRLDQPNPQQEAFKNAFQSAYRKLDQTHPASTANFFDAHFLQNRAAPLLARCLTRHGAPQPVELAVAWVEQLNLSADKQAIYIQEQTPAAAYFLDSLDAQLRACPEFHQIFDSHALDATASATTQMAETIEKLNATVAALPETQRQLIEVMQALSNQVMRALQQLTATPSVSITRPALPTNPPPAQLPPPPPPRSGICPFEYGTTVPPGRFYGRHRQRADIKIRIGGISAQCVSIVGMRRSGKSSLLRYIKGRLHEFCRPQQHAFVVTLDLHLKRFHKPVGLVEGLRRGIEKQIGHSPWEREENDDEWAVEDGLLALRDEGKRLIVLIDEFDSLGSRLHAFQGWGEDWRSKASAGYFALVIASLRPLDAIYQDDGLTSPFGNLFTQSELGALSDHEWQKLIHEGFARNGEHVSEQDLALIYDLAGGLPYYTQMAGALLWQHRDHTQTRAAFVHQARARFTELWNHLKENERQALRHIAGRQTGAAPNANLRASLQRYGLLRADGELFSRAFTNFMQGK